MNLTMPSQRSRWLPLSGILAALVLLVTGGIGLIRPPSLISASSATSSMLVQWHDARHDWLLVGDAQGDELKVYSAVDGRLLKSVPVTRGLNDASALAQRDGRLFVVGDNGKLGELALPQLTMIAARGP